MAEDYWILVQSADTPPPQSAMLEIKNVEPKPFFSQFHQVAGGRSASASWVHRAQCLDCQSPARVMAGTSVLLVMMTVPLLFHSVQCSTPLHKHITYSIS